MNAIAKYCLPVLSAGLIALTGCSGTDAAPPAAVVVPPPSTTAASTTPAPAPTRAQDLVKVKRAVMTTQALGKPWLQPKKVNTSGGKATEACPGRPAVTVLAPPRATTTTAFTRGAKPGSSIASFTVTTVTDQGAKHRAAWRRTVKACAEFKDASGLYVVTTLEGPQQLAGADDVVSRAERVYYDARHRKLAYARHFISARTGRAISTVEHDFLASKSDPSAQDFTPTTKLLALQLARTKAAFAD
jgi:hypothetical protein